MKTLRNIAVATLALGVVMGAGSGLAAIPPHAGSVNIDGLAVASHQELAAKFPQLSSGEIDKLLFRIADAASMRALAAADAR